MVEIRNPTDDPQALDELAAALQQAGGLAADRIILSLDEGTVVLAGAVATTEEADLAALIVEGGADAVRNELRIDENLREDPSSNDEPRIADSSARETDLAVAEHGGEVTDDVFESVSENIPLDPPDEPVLAPTAAEQRGIIAVSPDEPPADAGPLPPEEAEATTPSLPDLTAEQLGAIRPPGR